jgi:hypothetical protein
MGSQDEHAASPSGSGYHEELIAMAAAGDQVAVHGGGWCGAVRRRSPRPAVVTASARLRA